MKITKFIIIFIVCIFLTGCWDKVELEDRGLVLSLGLDKYNSDKNDNQLIYKVSMDIPNISSTSGSNESLISETGKEAEQKKDIKAAAGETIYSAIKLVDSYTSQRLYYGHTKAVVLGQKIIENETYLKETIDALERNQEISRKLIVLATKGDAYDILSSIPEERGLGIFINDFYKNNMYNTSFTFRQDLESIIQGLLLTGNTIIPEIESKNGDIQISGFAVIKDYKLVSWIDKDMSKNFLWFNKTKNIGGEVSVLFEEGYVPLKIATNNIKMYIKEGEGGIIANIDIDINGNIGEYTLSRSIMLDTDKHKILQQEYSEKIKKDVLDFLDIMQNNLNTDIIGLEELCMKSYSQIYKKFKFNETNILNYTKFDVNVNVNIKSAGNIK